MVPQEKLFGRRAFSCRYVRSLDESSGANVMQVSWWVELVVRPDDLDAFEALTCEMVAAARAEQGVLAYQRFISP